MPKNHQFSTKGFCGSTGILNVKLVYDFRSRMNISLIFYWRKSKIEKNAILNSSNVSYGSYFLAYLLPRSK